jgi:hypothetical protein
MDDPMLPSNEERALEAMKRLGRCTISEIVAELAPLSQREAVAAALGVLRRGLATKVEVYQVEARRG